MYMGTRAIVYRCGIVVNHLSDITKGTIWQQRNHRYRSRAVIWYIKRSVLIVNCCVAWRSSVGWYLIDKCQCESNWINKIGRDSTGISLIIIHLANSIQKPFRIGQQEPRWLVNRFISRRINKSNIPCMFWNRISTYWVWIGTNKKYWVDVGMSIYSDKMCQDYNEIKQEHIRQNKWETLMSLNKKNR